LLAYRVVMQVAQTSQPRELVGRHGSGETENVSDQLAVGVLALWFHDHLDTGQSKVLAAALAIGVVLLRSGWWFGSNGAATSSDV